MKIIYSIYLIGLLAILTSCADLPTKRGKNYTAIDRVHWCVIRMVEKNGVSPTEAESVCSRIFRRNMQDFGRK